MTTTELIVDGVQLRFPAGWQVVRWDEADQYRQGVAQVDGTKAVDVIGHREATLHLVELKNFVGHHIENKKRLTSHELSIEVAQKVRDTVAGVVAAGRTGNAPWTTFANALASTKHDIVVGLLSFVDLPRAGDTVLLNTIEQDMKRRLRWLTKRVWLATTQDSHHLPEVAVKILRPRVLSPK